MHYDYELNTLSIRVILLVRTVLFSPVYGQVVELRLNIRYCYIRINTISVFGFLPQEIQRPIID